MKGGDAPVTTAEPKAPDTSPAGNNKIPDEWFENDMAPNPELDKLEPEGFLDELEEQFFGKKKANPQAPTRRPARSERGEP
jgi:hypothetical protein